jgi:hypothetical protein
VTATGHLSPFFIVTHFQIQNITANVICLERVELEPPSESYTATPLNTTTDGHSVFCSINKLQPQNSCQFLYCIKPVPAVANDLKTLKMATSIGKLDIVWRSSNLAERGRLQTSQLQRSVSVVGFFFFVWFKLIFGYKRVVRCG